MARIVLGSYMVRYPLGGMMSWVLQYLVGFQRLGHDIVFVEKSGYANSCYDPVRNLMSDDPTSGIAILRDLLSRFGLENRWCFVDAAGNYHGMSQREIEGVFDSAALFCDMGTHGNWLSEAARTGLRVLIDGEPGFTQMKMQTRLDTGEALPEYDLHYTTGQNVGTARSTAPAGGKDWRHIYHPVVMDLFPPRPSAPDAPFTTVMNWQSYEPVWFQGIEYGHKDVEFRRFADLPRRTSQPLEVAVSGKRVPRTELEGLGWRVRDAHQVTVSFDAFARYAGDSKGEFSVCKSGYVATNTGWFSDRSAAYLASARPVVMQDTGFSAHLPCGEGLFAARTADDAAAALDEIGADHERHCRRAREIAGDHLDATKILGDFLHELGI